MCMRVCVCEAKKYAYLKKAFVYVCVCEIILVSSINVFHLKVLTASYAQSLVHDLHIGSPFEFNRRIITIRLFAHGLAIKVAFLRRDND